MESDKKHIKIIKNVEHLSNDYEERHLRDFLFYFLIISQITRNTQIKLIKYMYVYKISETKTNNNCLMCRATSAAAKNRDDEVCVTFKISGTGTDFNFCSVLKKTPRFFVSTGMLKGIWSSSNF